MTLRGTADRAAPGLRHIATLAALALSVTAGPAVAQTIPGQSSFGQANQVDSDAVVNLKAYAQYKMGHYDAARQLWEGLAAKGNTTALINLSNLFSQGGGVTADQKKAFGYTMKAAELGDSRAEHDVGLAYEKGQMVPRDIDKAGMWLKKSADQNDSDGEFAYGVWLATGRGKGLDKATPADKAQAVAYLKKAQAAGNSEAGGYIKALGEAKG